MQTLLAAQAKVQHPQSRLSLLVNSGQLRRSNGQLQAAPWGLRRPSVPIKRHKFFYCRDRAFTSIHVRVSAGSKPEDGDFRKEGGSAGIPPQPLVKILFKVAPVSRSRLGSLVLAVVTVAGLLAAPLIGRGLAAADPTPPQPAAPAVTGNSTTPAPAADSQSSPVPPAAPKLRTRMLTPDELVWLEQFRADALKAGVSLACVDRCLPLTIEPLLDVYEADRNQPEFKITFAQYLDRVVCDQRVRMGEAMLAEHRDIFDEIAAKYGIPENILVALWGVESSYGRICGSWDVIQSLFTLALTSDTPTRRAFFRNELMEAMKIWDGGHAGEGRMLLGSWAGAMGQCQFMPSSFRTYAIDHDGDGRADIWNSRADVLASIANYLASHGWKKGQPYGQRVTLPASIDSREFGLKTERTVNEWQAQFGVVTEVEGETPLPGDVKASLIAPDGPSGPAYLACANFRAVMAYNPSTYYATSVGDLAQRIAMRAKAKAVTPVANTAA